GKKQFTYTVSDGVSNAKATLTIAVKGNPVPVIQQDGYMLSADHILRLGVDKGLLANDSDPEGEQLTIADTGVFDTLFGGEVNIGTGGGFTYVSPPNFDGFDSFVYTATDGTNIAIGVATISVSP
ncbi:MAG: Ig-like domain-containing protein, partial [Desulfobacteraceae bacterium]